MNIWGHGADSILAVIYCEARLDNTAVRGAGPRRQSSLRARGYGISCKLNGGAFDREGWRGTGDRRGMYAKSQGGHA